jgi:hypothetical protein
MYWKWQKFIQQHQVVQRDKWHMVNDHESVFVQAVDIGCFYKEKVGGLVDEGV